MRKSIYIQFLLVIVALGVLFYVLIFHNTTYIEVPSPIGDFTQEEGATPSDEAESADAEEDMASAPATTPDAASAQKANAGEQRPDSPSQGPEQGQDQQQDAGAPPPAPQRDKGEDIGKTMRPPHPQSSNDAGRPGPPPGGNAGRPGAPPPGGQPGAARQETDYDGSQPKTEGEETLYR